MADAAQSATPDIQFFRDVFSASPIGIAVESLEGQPLFVNPAFCSFLGFSEEELRNKHCVDFSPPEDAEKDWGLFQQLRAGVIDRYQLEKRYFRRDRSLVWGSLSISLLKSSPSPLVLAMVEDITDKKKAEEGRYRHAAVIESSDDAIVSGTLDGIIVSWNTGAQKIYGYTEAEAVGKPISMLVPPELPDEENKILEKLKSGDRIQHFETVRVTKTGKRINVSLTISPIKDSTDRTVGVSGIARDISERKLAEEALRSSEERLRLAQQAARIGTFDCNIRTGVNTWTPELEAMYGLPPGGFGGTQTAFENLVHPDDLAGVIKLADAAMKSRQPTQGEWRVVWADGSVHWIAGCFQVFMDASGEPSKMIGVNIDITERKLAEEKLQEYAEAVEGSEEMMAVVDREYRYLIANRKFLSQRNMTKEQVVGRLVPEVLNKGVFETVVKDKLDECFRGKVVRYEMRYTYPALGERDLLISNFPIEGPGGVDRVACILQDITERKRAEDMLKESRETLRRIFHSTPDSITVVDLDGRIKLCNQATARIHGFSSVDQLIGKSVFELIAEEDRQRAEEIKRHVMIHGIARDVLFTGLKGNGEKFPGELSFALLKGASGRPTGFVGITSDITERKRAEEALSDMNRRVIEAEERERGRIAWDLHEDVGQRLALLAIAIEQLKNNLPHQAVELLDRVDAVWKQTLEILTDVKASAHELYSPRLEYLGIAAVMRSFCEEFGERKHVKIDFRNDGVPSLVQLDVSICLFRVLQEALHNGVKHSGVRKFEVQLWGASDAIHLTVRDSGAGFDTDAARKGRGLGLTRIEQRVKLVKGTFSIDSQPEKGTTVHVSVPIDSGGDLMRAAG